MRREARFQIYESQNVLESLITSINKASCSYEYGVLTIDILEDAPEYPYILNWLHEHNVRYDFNEHRTYSKKEIDNAKLYDVVLADPWEKDGLGEVNFNTEYDLTKACPRCGVGKRLTGDMFAQVSKMKKCDIVFLRPSIIVSPKVKRIILENGLTGCSFSPVRDWETQKNTEYDRLITSNEMPALNSKARIIHVSGCFCELCQSSGQILESEVVYNREDLEKVKDFNLSKEYFGLGKPMQNLIISKRVRDIFRREKIRVIYYEPVRIMEDGD